jgi:hypothetical protein
MYCPRCGTDNPETNNYCRECREDLKLIAGAVKKSLPVLLGGKIDAVLDSKTERFRRDSLLMLLMGIGFSLYLPLAALSGRSLWLPGLMALLGYIGSLWEWLAYQHSLSFGKELNLLVSTPIKPDDRLTTLKLTDHNIDRLSGPIKTMRVVSVHYCPMCGMGGQDQAQFCGGCGFELQAMRQALSGNAPQPWLRRHLDRYVRNRSTDEKIGEAAKMLLISGTYQLFSSIVLWIGGKPFDPVPLGIAMFCLFIGLWDYLLFRRRWNSIEIPVQEFMKNVQPDRAIEEDTILLPATNDQLQATQIDTRKLNSANRPIS